MKDPGVLHQLGSSNLKLVGIKKIDNKTQEKLKFPLQGGPKNQLWVGWKKSLKKGLYPQLPIYKAIYRGEN